MKLVTGNGQFKLHISKREINSIAKQKPNLARKLRKIAQIVPEAEADVGTDLNSEVTENADTNMDTGTDVNSKKHESFVEAVKSVYEGIYGQPMPHDKENQLCQLAGIDECPPESDKNTGLKQEFGLDGLDSPEPLDSPQPNTSADLTKASARRKKKSAKVLKNKVTFAGNKEQFLDNMLYNISKKW